MKEVVTEGKTRDDALTQALAQLGVPADQVEIEEMESQQRDRFFGLLSSRIIKLRVRVRETPPAPVIAPHREDREDHEAEAEPMSPESAAAAQALVTDFLSGVLQKMGVDLDVSAEIQDGVVCVTLDGDDSGMIIGKFGQTLDSLQYLTNVVVGKQNKDKTKVVIHVGDYRRRREASLRRMAKAMAYKVLKSKKKVVLSPMPPQDRRIIHLALANFRHITTGSEGVGPDRRVVISYKN